MHGLINKSIQSFVRDTYGAEAWAAVAADANLGFDSFEAMLSYEGEQTDAILNAGATHLGKTVEELLEDLGTYLVSHPNVQSLRRLLRFGGDSFVEFLHSLDELHDRAKLAVNDLEVPQLELRDHGGGRFTLLVIHDRAGFGHVIVGVLRAMADDYGALAMLDHQGRRDRVDTVQIELLESSFAAGRDFELGQRAS